MPIFKSLTKGLLLLAPLWSLAAAAETGIVFDEVEDLLSKGKTSEYTENQHSCGAGWTGNGRPLGTAIPVVAAEGEPDHLKVWPTPWHNGGFLFGCREKVNWSCVKSCFDGGSFGNNPTFTTNTHLVFEARVTNPDADCKPSISLTKRWPMYGSNVIELEGEYVDGGKLVDNEYRTVVVPTQAFATAEWPTVNSVKNLWFRTCGSHNLVYHISNVILTDDPPAIAAAAVTDEPTAGPSSQPSPEPTIQPTTLAPTAEPTPLPDILIFGSVEDGMTTGEPEALSCVRTWDGASAPYGSIAHAIASTESSEPDFLRVAPDPWHSGGLDLGCKEKDSSWNCIKHCATTDFSKHSYLVFKAKAIDPQGEGCQPTIGLGKRWPQYHSNVIELAESYVDTGALVEDEWRNVVIPTADFISDTMCDGELCWPELTDVKTIWFRSCGTDSAEQPVYKIADITLTNDPPELLSSPPSSAPTEYVSVSPSLATHRLIHHHYYPILGEDREPEGNTWLTCSNNEWPTISRRRLNTPPPEDHTTTVLVPKGQVVTYSGADTLKYDKVIVEGTLNIKPVDADVKLTLGTLVVEMMGTLNIETDAETPYTVTIEIDGGLDRAVDPQEFMVGFISLSGMVVVQGNDVPTKMAAFADTALAGATSLTVVGTDAATNWAVGDEIVLPDTQEGLDADHYSFPNNEPNYHDQTEQVIITGLSTASDGNTVIDLSAPLQYSHSVGCNAAHVTRSVNFVTSSSSVDRGHIMHTGMGMFDFKNARVENFGRTTTELISSTLMEDLSGLNFALGSGLAQMSVVQQGTNQIARYALHAHHSMVELMFHGNAILFSPRNGIVNHNSRVHVTENVVVGADGSGIFLEDSTETGPVKNNYLIGTGGGTRGGDDGRFSTMLGTDLGHGGFGIWARGIYSNIENNRAEGHFGVSPYGFFVHPNFVSGKPVQDIPGTPEFLVGKSSRQVSEGLGGDLTLQTFGSFVNNSARGTWRTGLSLLYFGKPALTVEGHIIENMELEILASSGKGVSTTHSKVFTMKGGFIRGTISDNSITGVWCNSCNTCTLDWRLEGATDISVVEEVRGGNC